MSIGSSQGCSSTVPQVMLEKRLQTENTAPENSQPNTVEISTASQSLTEAANIDTNTISNNASVQDPSSINAVQATQPITNSVIQETIESNKTTTASYQTNGQQAQSFSSGLLVDIKV